MRRGLIALVVIVATAAIGFAVWRRTVADPVRRTASLAGNPDQEQLWKDAASAHTRSALERLAAPQPIGQVLPTKPVQPPVKPPPPPPGSIPSNVATTIRIVSAMSPNLTEFIGRATVVSLDQNGERIGLAFGAKRELAIVAKVAGKPIGVSKGDLVDMQLRWRPGRLAREHIIAVRTQTGIEVASIVVAGPEPVTLKLPLLSGGTLIATQTGPPLDGSQSLQVEGPGFNDTIDVPKTGMGVATDRQYGDRSIRVLGSTARPEPGSDGAPYGIDIITWRLK